MATRNAGSRSNCMKAWRNYSNREADGIAPLRAIRRDDGDGVVADFV